MKPLLIAVSFVALTGVLDGGFVAAAAERQAPAEARVIPAEQLPVSLERIKRKLVSVPPTQRSVLRLNFYVEVYGRAPELNLFESFDVHNGPVPYGAPTHADLLRQITPREFRTPPIPILAPLQALYDWLSRR